jgi:hypothetical protein
MASMDAYPYNLHTLPDTLPLSEGEQPQVFASSELRGHHDGASDTPCLACAHCFYNVGREGTNTTCESKDHHKCSMHEKFQKEVQGNEATIIYFISFSRAHTPESMKA